MSSVVIETRTFGHIVGVCVVDEVLNLLAVFLFVFAFVLVVDFGLDIEEGIASVTTSFPAMALRAWLGRVMLQGEIWQCTDLLHIILVFVILLVIVVRPLAFLVVAAALVFSITSGVLVIVVITVSGAYVAIVLLFAVTRAAGPRPAAWNIIVVIYRIAASGRGISVRPLVLLFSFGALVFGQVGGSWVEILLVLGIIESRKLVGGHRLCRAGRCTRLGLFLEAKYGRSPWHRRVRYGTELFGCRGSRS